MRYVLFYESADRVAERAPAHFPEHSRLLQEFHGRGELLMVGTFEDPQADGSMAIFTTADAARAFVGADPFVREGVVRSWRILGWNEVLASGDAAAGGQAAST